MKILCLPAVINILISENMIMNLSKCVVIFIAPRPVLKSLLLDLGEICPFLLLKITRVIKFNCHEMSDSRNTAQENKIIFKVDGSFLLSCN